VRERDGFPFALAHVYSALTVSSKLKICFRYFDHLNVVTRHQDSKLFVDFLWGDGGILDPGLHLRNRRVNSRCDSTGLLHFSVQVCYPVFCRPVVGRGNIFRYEMVSNLGASGLLDLICGRNFGIVRRNNLIASTNGLT
jgi:hypothetical protein